MLAPLTPLTYATALDYLLGLGKRFKSVGRSELSFSGEASANSKYPLLLVEGDALGDEGPTGLDTFTIAVQVLTTQGVDGKPSTTQELLKLTNRWADQFTEQLRAERPQQLARVSKLALPAVAGTALATGWRVELTLRIVKELDRITNKALFEPEVL